MREVPNKLLVMLGLVPGHDESGMFGGQPHRYQPRTEMATDSPDEGLYRQDRSGSTPSWRSKHSVIFLKKRIVTMRCTADSTILPFRKNSTSVFQKVVIIS